jgi:hypothetical protein
MIIERKVLFWLSCVIVCCCMGLAFWHEYSVVHAQQGTLTFPDVITPSTAQSTALIAWKSAVETDLQAHESRLAALEAKLNNPAPTPSAPSTLTAPTVVGGSISGNLIVGTTNGTIATWTFPGPAGTYQVGVTGAGPNGVLQLLINGQPPSPPILINLPPSSPAVQAVTVSLPGPCTIGFRWIGSWANVSTTLTVQ